MGFKENLDRYLTSEPDNSYTEFCESVVEVYSDKVYEQMVALNFCGSELENKWLNKLFPRLERFDLILSDGDPDVFGDIYPLKAARIIERAFQIYFRREIKIIIKNNLK